MGRHCFPWWSLRAFKKLIAYLETVLELAQKSQSNIFLNLDFINISNSSSSSSMPLILSINCMELLTEKSFGGVGKLIGQPF